MQIPTIVLFVWWAANEKSKIYQAIDNVGDNFRTNFAQIDKRLDLHIQDSFNARDNLYDKVSGQGRIFGAKFKRIERYIEYLLGKKIKELTSDE